MYRHTRQPDYSVFGELPSQYRVQKLVSHGESGIILEVTDILLDRTLAVKILSYSRDADAKSSERFEREAKVLAALNHPNIVRILSSGFTSTKRPYFVLEWLNGEDLASRLLKEPVLPAAIFIEFFLQILEGLSFAHTNNVLHRSIKPSSLIICDVEMDNFCAKIADFGVARVIASNPEEMTSDHSDNLSLVPAYMSPEQCSRSPAQKASDIYSLACVMYECLSGRPLFQGETDVEVMYKHLQEPVPPLALGVGERQLARLVMSGLEKEPGKRPSAQELVAGLSRIKAERSGRLSSGTPVSRVQACFLLVATIAAVTVIACLIQSGSPHRSATGEKSLSGSSRDKWLASRIEEQNTRELNTVRRSVSSLRRNLGYAQTEAEKKYFAELMVKRLEDLADQAPFSEQISSLKEMLLLCPLLPRDRSFERQCYAHRTMAWLYYNAKSMNEAEAEISQAFSVAAESRDTELQTGVCVARARMLIKLEKFKEADIYVKRAVSLFRSMSDTRFGLDVKSPSSDNSLQSRRAAEISEVIEKLTLSDKTDLFLVLKMNNRLLRLMVDRGGYEQAKQCLRVSKRLLNKLNSLAAGEQDLKTAEQETLQLATGVERACLVQQGTERNGAPVQDKAPDRKSE